MFRLLDSLSTFLAAHTHTLRVADKTRTEASRKRHYYTVIALFTGSRENLVRFSSIPFTQRSARSGSCVERCLSMDDTSYQLHQAEHKAFSLRSIVPETRLLGYVNGHS
ncbi:hypothetical protein RRG08_033577 [Elysia crispata]|uniref:Uncharacterized protein n=1 Tax=Elysia crispata TaxID=231223 RepID=A0AAE0XP77_9GAST|nr:hypothetical protein RRG08_033577 [Elysia crispata]